MEKSKIKNDYKSIEEIERENKFLNDTINNLKEENNMLNILCNKTGQEATLLRKQLKVLQERALLVSEVVSVDYVKKKVIIKLTNGNIFYCNFNPETESLKKLQSDDTVLVDQSSLNVIDKIEMGKEVEVEKYVIIEKPTETWAMIGGLIDEKEEIKEVIELPLTHPELFKKIGIKPPKGVLLYGPPGTGKTLLAKAVANSTNATFIEVVGSELVQKFIGEGAKLIKKIFDLARKRSPAIIFIDEIDALAGTRMEMGTSGEREVNRTFMQLLAELDGFKHLDNVKVIGATNRKDILDPAIIRPGRLDRLIHVDLPNDEGRREIFKVHSKDMPKNKLLVNKIIRMMENFSGAEIRAVCTEAGYFAIRANRDKVSQKDFEMAIEKVKKDEEQNYDHDHKFYG
jgi:proteasome regulatory subunit